jgi:hypothetical protein
VPGRAGPGQRASAVLSDSPARTACTASAVWFRSLASGSDGLGTGSFTARSLRSAPGLSGLEPPLRYAQAV